MKRSYLLVLAAMVTLAMVAGAAIAQEATPRFSEPILVGGEDPEKPAETTAVGLGFFAHPRTQGMVNFGADKGLIEIDTAKVYVNDIQAVPGYESKKEIIPQHLDFSPNRADLSLSPPMLERLHGTGSDDITIKTPGYRLDIGLDYWIAGGLASHSLMLADVRVEESGEFAALFLQDPLETFMIAGEQSALIGSAAPVSPYDAYQPATVVSATKAFKWCLNPFTTASLGMPIVGFQDCAYTIGTNEYTSAIMYDAVDIGNGKVAAVYDPLLVYEDAELFGGFNNFGISVEKSTTSRAYYSPLSFFRKVGVEPNAKYRFSGYTAWELPDIDLTSPLSGLASFYKMVWPFILTNWIMPAALNPISIEAVDLKGASSDAYPNSDLAVAYQQTLFAIDSMVLDAKARPAVMGDGHINYRDVLVACSDFSCSSYEPLTPDLFPDSQVSLLVLWKQAREWQVASDSGDYVTMNPSHVFDPMHLSAMVGPGMYDTTVLIDFADDPELKKQHVLVPSGLSDSAGGIVYQVPISDNPPVLGYKASVVNASTYTPTFCEHQSYVVPTPLILPEVLTAERPEEGFVPYEINSGYITSDRCADFIVTWRGKDTVADPENAGFVKFDDGTGRQFAGAVTLGLRREASPGVCGDVEYRQISIPNVTQIASASIGQFYLEGEGNYLAGVNMADIVIGNAVAESDGAGGYSAYAYVLKGAADFSTMPQDMERMRVGHRVFTDPDEAIGVARIAADYNESGPDSIAQVMGKPLALADMGCPDYANPDDPTVASAFEQYSSIIANVWSIMKVNTEPGKFAVKMPFRDAEFHPTPASCGLPDGVEKCIVEYGGMMYELPFYAKDPCCLPPCATVSGSGDSIPEQTLTVWLGNQCGQYIVNLIDGYMLKSCHLVDYAKAFPDVCPMSENDAMDRNEALAASDDQGDEGGGETDFAWNYRPDTVVGYDAAAIARASDLLPAQELRAPSAAGAAASRFSLRDAMAGFVEREFGANPQAMQTLEGIFADPNFQDAAKMVDERLSKPNGPPMALEEVFLMPLVWSYEMGKANAAAGRADDTNINRAAGCSLIPHEGAAVSGGAWDAVVSKLTALVDRLTDVFVKDADAACGVDGVLDANEQCHDSALPWGDTCPVDYSCVASDCLCKDSSMIVYPYPLCGNGVLESFPSTLCDGYAETCEEGIPCTSGGECIDCRCRPLDTLTEVCGNGIKEGAESCDPGDGNFWQNDSVNCAGGICLPDCTCTARYCCGNQQITSPEQCDVAAVQLDNYGCDPLATCNTSCECETPSTATLLMELLSDLKVPKGQVMPGHREMTAVVRLEPNLCSPPDGVKTGSEECDLYGLEVGTAEYRTALAEQCPDVGFGPASVCEINCTCYYPGETPVQGIQNGDCLVSCATFPSEESAEKYKAANDEFRLITGRADDFICPDEQGVTVLCRVDGASAPELSESDISLSLAGTPVYAGNVTAYAIDQTGGSKLIDSTTLQYKSYEAVEQPIRLLPLEGGQAAAIVVPDLAAAAAAVPMAATSMVQTSQGVLVNNMYEHRVFAASADDAVSLQMSAPVGLLPGTAITIHELKLRTVNTGGSWVAVPGAQEGVVPVEDRIDWVKLKQMMADKVAQLGGQAATSAIYVDSAYPVVPNQRYAFNLYQEKYSEAGGTPETVEVPFGFIVGEPVVGAKGGGCGCFVAGGEPTAGSVLPIAVALLVPAAGIAYGRVRRRRGRND